MPEARKTTPAVRRFGGFELNPRTGELRKGGVRVSVPEQPLKVLDRLLERPGELVTREELRQRLWAGDTFVDFEHGLNAAVKRLREALGDSAENPRFVETLPRRGYRFIAILEEDGTRSEVGDVASIQIPRDQDERPLQTPRKSSGWLKRRPGWLVGAGLAGIAIASFGAWQIRQTPAAPPTIVPLTLLAGLEFSPTFSPDGTQVAFGWNGPSSGDFDRGFDIYVKMVGSADVRPLLIHPGSDGFPRWSPDGREIAYLRRDAVRQVWHVRVMSALGGAAREVSDIPVMPGISWSPDGRYIVAAGAAPHSGIHLLSVKDGERRVILQPSGSATVGWPAIAPNGRVLAYASCEEPVFNTNCYVQTVGLDTAFGLQGEPRRLTRQFAWRIRGVTTTRDGQDVIYQVEQPPTSTLWRVGIDGTRPPQRIEAAGITAWSPTLAPSGNRLAFSRLVQDEDVYRLTPDGSSQPVARSPAFDSNPQVAPDGRFAFCSTRSVETVEVWIADADGSNAEQLTHGPGTWQCSPTWSPDGQQIAFDSQASNGDWHIWTIDVERRRLKQITTDRGSQNMPTWSHDGEWIYFSWDQGQGRDIWRVHLERGTREQLTRGGGGLVARESSDGQSVLYQPKLFDAAVMAQPLAGGAPHIVIPCVTGTAYSVLPDRIYYIPCTTGFPPNPPVNVLNTTTGEVREWGRLERYQYDNVPSGFGVSPDGRTVYYARLVSIGADLMLIEHFR